MLKVHYIRQFDLVSIQVEPNDVLIYVAHFDCEDGQFYKFWDAWDADILNDYDP